MFLNQMRTFFRATLFCTLLAAIGCNTKPGDNSTQNGLTPQEARPIAKEAYIYGFPMAANYQTLYKQAIDATSRDSLTVA